MAAPISSALTWIPVYLQRIHEMSIPDSGRTLGIIISSYQAAGFFSVGG